jgi:hypothetical protein
MMTEMGNALRLLQEMVTSQRGLNIESHGLLLVVTETGKVKECRFESLSDIAAIVDAIGTTDIHPEDK